MLQIDIPGRDALKLQHAVFDVNGTLAVDGVALPGVAQRLQELSQVLSIHLLTAGTHGRLDELEASLGFSPTKISSGRDKLAYIEQLGPASVVAFGNGANDGPMLRRAALGIAILAGEGLARSALEAADLLVLDPVSALDLLLFPKRLIATLRT